MQEAYMSKTYNQLKSSIESALTVVDDCLSQKALTLKVSHRNIFSTIFLFSVMEWTGGKNDELTSMSKLDTLKEAPGWLLADFEGVHWDTYLVALLQAMNHLVKDEKIIRFRKGCMKIGEDVEGHVLQFDQAEAATYISEGLSFSLNLLTEMWENNQVHAKSAAQIEACVHWMTSDVFLMLFQSSPSQLEAHKHRTAKTLIDCLERIGDKSADFIKLLSEIEFLESLKTIQAKA